MLHFLNYNHLKALIAEEAFANVNGLLARTSTFLDVG